MSGAKEQHKKSLDRRYTDMITSVMLAWQPTFLAFLPGTLTPLLRYSYKPFVVPEKVISFGIREIRTLLIKHPGLESATLGSLTPPSLLSSLLFITYVQALCFQAITHSFAQRASSILPVFSSLCTLSIVTGVVPPITLLQEHAAAAVVQFLQPRGRPDKVVPAQIEFAELAQGSQNFRNSRESVPPQIEVAQLPQLLERMRQRS